MLTENRIFGIYETIETDNGLEHILIADSYEGFLVMGAENRLVLVSRDADKVRTEPEVLDACMDEFGLMFAGNRYPVSIEVKTATHNGSGYYYSMRSPADRNAERIARDLLCDAGLKEERMHYGR